MKKTSSAVLALMMALPVLTLADSNGTATIAAGGSFSFDTGSNVSSGGDITFTGSSITFNGKAKGIVLKGFTGSSGYADITEPILAVFAVTPGAFSSSPITASSLAAGTSAGTVIGLETNAGNYAKFLVTALSSGSLGIQYGTYGSATGGGGGPTITDIQNNSSLIPAGFPNSGVAPSTLFVIHGTGMASATTVSALQDSSAGLPTTLNGATVTITAGGKSYTPGLYYAIATQIAGVLPAAVPPGSATLTVSYNGATSASFSFTVVASAYGIDTYDGNLAVAQDAVSYGLINYTNSGKAGQIVVLWGSGLGADPADSDTTYTGTPHAINTATQIYVGGVQVPSSSIAYVGASVYPGVHIIQFTLPSGVPNGCYVPVAVVTGGTTLSNMPTIPYMDGGGVCNDPQYGITGTQIGSFSSQTVRTGAVEVGQLVEPVEGTFNFAGGSFESVTGLSFGSSSSSGSTVSVGSCVVSELVSSGTTGGTITSTPLDAGTITVQGPAGTYPLSELTKGVYDSQLPASAIPATGGAFVFTASGGADVGPFTATVNLPNPILTWTNQSAAATVTRSQGLQIAWTGGASASYVFISGSSSANGAAGGFFCYAPQSALQFTVPSYVLLALPAGTGSVSLENLTGYSSFSATGLDFGYAIGFTGVGVTSTYQ